MYGAFCTALGITCFALAVSIRGNRFQRDLYGFGVGMTIGFCLSALGLLGIGLAWTWSGYFPATYSGGFCRHLIVLGVFAYAMIGSGISFTPALREYRARRRQPAYACLQRRP